MLGASGGLGQGVFLPSSFSLQNKLRQKLTVMYGQINGASRALEDVRARQQEVQVSDGAPGPALPRPGACLCPHLREGGHSSGIHVAPVGFTHSVKIQQNMQKSTCPERSFLDQESNLGGRNH